MYRARYPRVCTTRLPLCLRNMLIQYVWRIHAQNDTQIMDYMIWCMNSFVCVFVCVRVRACMRMGVCVRVCMCFLYGDVHVQWPAHSLNALCWQEFVLLDPDVPCQRRSDLVLKCNPKYRRTFQGWRHFWKYIPRSARFFLRDFWAEFQDKKCHIMIKIPLFRCY